MTVGTVNRSHMSIIPLMWIEHRTKIKVIWKVFNVSVKYTARPVKSDSKMIYFYVQNSFLVNKMQNDQ